MKKFAETVIKNGGEFFGVNENGEMTYEIKGLTSSPLIIFGDWVSPEDHQAEIAKLNSKINWLHSLLDERNEEVLQTVKRLNEAIPEIPEFVATEIERLKSEGIKTLCDFYNCDVDWMTFGMEDLRGDELAVAKWFYHNTETFELAYSYGYTVAKEKRFYLKHIDFCKRDKDYDWYMIKHSDGPLNHLRVEKGTLPPTVDTYFTQQEIDSMETGSYEQFEVEE